MQKRTSQNSQFFSARRIKNDKEATDNSDIRWSWILHLTTELSSANWVPSIDNRKECVTRNCSENRHIVFINRTSYMRLENDCNMQQIECVVFDLHTIYLHAKCVNFSPWNERRKKKTKNNRQMNNFSFFVAKRRGQDTIFAADHCWNICEWNFRKWKADDVFNKTEHWFVRFFLIFNRFTECLAHLVTLNVENCIAQMTQRTRHIAHTIS